MKTFELTFSVKTRDGSDIDLSDLEAYLSEYENTDMEFIEMDVIEPSEVMVTFEVEAASIRDCPDELHLLNDEGIVDDTELFISERVSHTSY